MVQKTVPLNDLGRRIATFRDQLSQATSEFLQSGHFILGKGVEEFERSFAGYCDVAHCISVANGTDALEIALKAVGVGPGDRVALCANAAMYGTSATLASGAIPVYIDSDAITATMCHDALRRELAASGPVKAIIVTHLYGRLADMDRLCAVAASVDARVVEDCAQAHGAMDGRGRMAGAMGDAASFSFYPTKNLGALGDGGAVITASDEAAEKARRLRQYGWSSKYHNVLSGGRNSRLDELQARYLSIMLGSLDEWNEKRRRIADHYGSGIRNPQIALPAPADTDYVAHLYVVRCERRDALRAHLASLGIQSEVHYPIPDHRQSCHGGRYDGVRLPNTERDADIILTLPCFPELTDEEIERVIEACNRF